MVNLHFSYEQIYGSRMVPGKKNILSGGRNLLSEERERQRERECCNNHIVAQVEVCALCEKGRLELMSLTTKIHSFI